MYRKLLLIVLAFISFVLVIGLCACDKTAPTDTGTDLLSITGVTFSNKTVTYDGTEQSVTVIGLPEGASVTYTSNTAINSGTYSATALITKEGYNPLTLTATLTINKLNFTGITFNGLTTTYDASEHTLAATGVPEFATATYSGTRTAQNAGTYNASVLITAPNYNDLTLNATLTINKLNFTGITFDGLTTTYNASEHTLAATGVPEFATATYSGTRTAQNAGTYNASVLITAPNYNDLTLNATLIINKATLGQFTFYNDTFEYDTQKHTIAVTGLLPAGENAVSYTGGEDGKNGATSVGSYNIVAVIGGKNYTAITLEAVLKIRSTEEPLYTVIYNDNIYFQNALDYNKLYCYDGSTIEKVNNDIPTCFIVNGASLYYLTQNLFTKGITSFDGENSEDLFTVSGDFLVTDGTYVYYAVTNFLKPNTNGIYRISLADLNNQSVDPVASRICGDKAEYLTIINDYIYFTNNSDGGKLYRVNSSSTEGTSEKVYDYKVSDLTASSNNLYFTRHITLTNLSPGAAIYSIDTSAISSTPLSDESSAIEKISYSKGKYLTIIGDYIYFVNTDMITTTIFGDGIYKARIDGSDYIEEVIGGIKVIDAADDNVYALSTDGTNLYYYRANDKHLYCYNGTDEIDLMQDFVVPEYTELITTYYAEMKEYEGELYYINMTDGGKLYKYNIDGDFETCITNLQVADFAIFNGCLYYSTVRLAVNFDLYKMDLVTGENERISTEKCMHFAFYNDQIFYANFSDNNTLNRMNLDGTDDTILFGEETIDDYDIYVLDGKVYFVADGELYCYTIASSSATIVNDDANPNEYLVLDTGIAYLMNDRATKNWFAKIDLTTETLTTIGDLGSTNDCRSFFIVDNYIYYYRNVAAGSSNKGLYKVDMESTTPEAILVTDLVDGEKSYYMSSAVVMDNLVYFLDVWQIKNSLPTTASTGSLYVLDLTDNSISMLK